MCVQCDAETALERLSDVLEKDLPHFYSKEEFWRERGTIRDEVRSVLQGTLFGSCSEGCNGMLVRNHHGNEIFHLTIKIHP